MLKPLCIGQDLLLHELFGRATKRALIRRELLGRKDAFGTGRVKKEATALSGSLCVHDGLVRRGLRQTP